MSSLYSNAKVQYNIEEPKERHDKPLIIIIIEPQTLKGSITHAEPPRQTYDIIQKPTTPHLDIRV